MDRAGTALRDAAAVFRAGQTNILTNRPQQRRLGADIDVVGLSVYVKTSHSQSSCMQRSRTEFSCPSSASQNARPGSRNWRHLSLFRMTPKRSPDRSLETPFTVT